MFIAEVDSLTVADMIRIMFNEKKGVSYHFSSLFYLEISFREST